MCFHWPMLLKKQCIVRTMLPLYVKSLYGANNTTNITNDKRLTTEMGVVKEMIERNEISLVWIDNKHWFADIDKERGLKCITY